MEKKLFQPHYDREFKRKVVEEYLVTGCSKMFLLKKYNIQFKSAIQTWMRILGYKDPGNQLQRVKFNNLILPVVAKKIDLNNNDELQKRIKELEQELAEEKLRSEAYARIIDKAEKELKIPIRKKLNSK